VAAQPDERHANRTASVLEWYDRHRTYNIWTSGSNEEDDFIRLSLIIIFQREIKKESWTVYWKPCLLVLRSGKKEDEGHREKKVSG